MAESKLFTTINCIIYCRSIIFGHIFAFAKTWLSAIPLPLQPLSSLRSESGRLRRGSNPLCGTRMPLMFLRNRGFSKCLFCTGKAVSVVFLFFVKLFYNSPVCNQQ